MCQHVGAALKETHPQFGDNVLGISVGCVFHCNSGPPMVPVCTSSKGNAPTVWRQCTWNSCGMRFSLQQWSLYSAGTPHTGATRRLCQVMSTGTAVAGNRHYSGR